MMNSYLSNPKSGPGDFAKNEAFILDPYKYFCTYVDGLKTSVIDAELESQYKKYQASVEANLNALKKRLFEVVKILDGNL